MGVVAGDEKNATVSVTVTGWKKLVTLDLSCKLRQIVSSYSRTLRFAAV